MVGDHFLIHSEFHVIHSDGSRIVCIFARSRTFFGFRISRDRANCCFVCGLLVHLLLHDDFVGEESDPVLEVRHDAIRGSPILLPIKFGVIICGLIKQGHQKLILARIVQTGDVWIIKKRLGKYLLIDFWTKMRFVSTLKHFALIVTICGRSSLINEVLLDKLLKLFQEKHSFSIIDRQSAEGIETGVFKLARSLRFGWDWWHQVTVFSRQIQISKHLSLILHNVPYFLLLAVQKAQRNRLLNLERLVHLLMNVNVILVELGFERFGQSRTLGRISPSILDFQITGNLVFKLRKDVVKSFRLR